MKFRKKPVVIEAELFDGSAESAAYAVIWIGKDKANERVVGGARKATKPQRCVIDIKTLEGTLRAEPGDYIICGVKGEFYPCKPDIFAATYEPGEPDAAPATGGTR